MNRILKVLLACPPSGNPYVSELLRYLNSLDDVSCIQSHRDMFDEEKLSYDVIHIQWPEAVFGWNAVITENDLALLEASLDKFKQIGSKVFVTVHNEAPHGAKDSIYSDLYEVIYRKADAFIHLGSRSLELLDSGFENVGSARQFVIPHGNYGFFNEVRKETPPTLPVRRRFRVLCFGAIRNLAEVKIVCQAAEYLSRFDGELVVAGRILSGNKKTLNYYKMHLPLHLRRNIQLVKGKVPDDAVSSLVSSCDAVFIPRVDTLNSGNVALGFTFGKVVLGPSIGVIGEELMKLGNPTFDPSDEESLKDAIANLVNLVNSPLGQRNRAYAEKEMSWPEVARLHREAYLSF